MVLRAAAQQILFVMMLQVYLGSGEFSQSNITTFRCCQSITLGGGDQKEEASRTHVSHRSPLANIRMHVVTFGS